MITQFTPVPFTHVTFGDSFWAPRIETNRAVTIPAEYELCERTGRIAAWNGTWRQGDPNPPHIFWDSDVAKWIEAASYLLATRYDAQLDARLDDVIAKLARLQRPDGYLNSHYILVEPDKCWSNLRNAHELYCAGHLIEAAVAHHQATGKRSMLDVVCRYADHIDATFGRELGQRRGYCGHEEIELALVKLYHVSGEQRYLKLAQYFIDERGRQPHYFDIEARARGEDPREWKRQTYAYMQAHMPVREQREVVGHAVRAMYLYSAMADLAGETGDATLLAACERLWHSVCDTQMYLTGGIGQTHTNEGFTGAYDLPDETAYAETCAAIGLVFWAHRMLHLTADGQYADVMERALYNGALSGVSLDGRKFFYENPLASRGSHHRQEWFDCACCPPNIARLLASLGGYVYSQTPTPIPSNDPPRVPGGGGRTALPRPADPSTSRGSTLDAGQEREGVWVHLYAQGEAKLGFGDRTMVVRQTTCYPWDGAIQIEMQMPAPMTFTLHLRVPGWCERWQVRINDVGAIHESPLHNGYIHLAREWSPGDTVTLNLAMPVRYVYAHPHARQTAGRVALQRGPIVYCLEGVDYNFISLDRIALRTDVPAHRIFRAEHRRDGQSLGLPLQGGVTLLRGQGVVIDDDTNEALYRFAPSRTKPIDITAMPYCVWDHRAPGEMRVWLRAISANNANPRE